MAVQGIGLAGTIPVSSTANTTNTGAQTSPGSAPSEADLITSAGASADTDAAIVSINNQTFSNKVEKYLNDYDKGQGYLDPDTKNQVLDKGEALAQSLDPRSLKNYLGYTTTFSHDAKLRFINGTADGISQINSILRKSTAA